MGDTGGAVQSGLVCEALKKLKAQGLVKLPVKRACRASRMQIAIEARADAQDEVKGTVRDYAPIQLSPVTGKDGIGLWNEYVECHHVLGYKRPFGAHQGYFIEGKNGDRFGCLLFASSGRWRSAIGGLGGASGTGPSG